MRVRSADLLSNVVNKNEPITKANSSNAQIRMQNAISKIEPIDTLQETEMNQMYHFIFYLISITCNQEEGTNALIEQLITQLAINRDALNVDRQTIGKLIYNNKQLAQDIKDLQSKIVDLEKGNKHPTSEEALELLAEKIASKLTRYLLRELGSVKTLALVSIFADKNNNNNNKFKELLEVRVRRKLAANKSLSFLNIDSEEKIQRSWSNSLDKDIVFKSLNSEAEILVLLIIEYYIEDCYLDVFFKESPDNVVVPPVQKLKQTPAQAPAQAPYRFFKR